MSENYVSLHGHSTYSMLDGYGKMGQIVSRYLELGQDAGAVTDHGNIIAHVPFDKAMRAAGLKPIFGCEFYIVDDMTEKKSKHQPSLGADGAPHVTVIAQTQAGYQNILKLSTLSWREGFYYKPRIDWNCLARHQEGLVVLSGCVGGYPSTLINGKGPEAAWRFLGQRMQEIENLFVELIPEPGLGISHSSLPWLVKIARDLGLPMVLTSDAHFPRPEDHVAEDTMLCIGLGTTMKDPKRVIRLPEFQYYCSKDELIARAVQTLQGHMDFMMMDDITVAMSNTRLIADACEVEIPRVPPLLFPGVTKDEAPTVLWSKVAEGLDQRVAQGRVRQADWQSYHDRAVEEFNMLQSKGFCDYILVLTDICRWARAQNSLVMCRGSAGGCLLLYLLGCSETDSVLHDLDFSRFMDPSRNDPPDIDVDFETSMRQPVYDYIASKYGESNVCQILTLNLIRARVAVQDMASVHGIPREQYAPLSAALDSKDDDVDKQIAGLTDPTALAVLDKYPVFRHLDGIVGQCRQTGVHAAGVLISSRPIQESIAVMHQPGKARLSSVDKHGAQEVGFLKLDSLGVSNYDVLADAVRSIGANIEWLYSLGYETEKRFSDPGVYQVAQSGKVAGVFQLDGAAMHVGQKIGLDVFEEIYAVSALCRPGAVQHVPTYARNKFDRPEFERFMSAVHPIAAEVVRKTYGILAYQEQVMKLCNKLGGIPMEKVQKLRKRIANASFHGKELGAEYGDQFTAGCIERGCSAEEAAYWWDSIKAHGIYCVSGDTIISSGSSGINGGGDITIAEYYHKTREQQIFVRKERNGSWNYRYTGFASKFRAGKCNLLQMDVDSRIRPKQVLEVVHNGQALTFQINTEHGHKIRVTANHRMLTQRGYVKCGELGEGDSLIAMGEYEQTIITSQSKWGQTPPHICIAVVARANDVCELCGKVQDIRYEVSHIKDYDECMSDQDIYHSLDNVLYLCNSCHKNIDYQKEERKKRWSKGRPTYQTKITSIDMCHKEDVYCVVMGTEQQNFMANGLVSHNSFNKAHCVTYAIVGYWMLYMKAHYPDAYFASYLKHEGASTSCNPLLMKRLIREFRAAGGRLSLLDPTLSKSSFSSNGANSIVGGWGNILGVGEKQAAVIERSGPYTSWESLKGSLPMGLYYKLHEAGLTGAMPYNQQAAIELAPWMPVLSTGQLEAAIKRDNCVAGPGDLPEGEELKGNAMVCGYVTVKHKKARTGHFKGEVIIYVLEDENGAIEFRVSSKNPKLSTRLKDGVQKGDYVAVSGWWAGNCMFVKDFSVLSRRQ